MDASTGAQHVMSNMTRATLVLEAHRLGGLWFDACYAVIKLGGADLETTLDELYAQQCAAWAKVREHDGDGKLFTCLPACPATRMVDAGGGLGGLHFVSR
jgi:hypothetical protein